MFSNQDVGFVSKIDDVTPSYHLVGKTLSQMVNFTLSKSESILIISFFIFLILYAIRLTLSTFKNVREAIFGVQKLEFQ
jgi:hypothetical protein